MSALKPCNYQLELSYEQFVSRSRNLSNLMIGRWVIEQQIGNGVSAKVYRCIDKFTKEPFAMKVIDIEFAWGRSLASIRNKYVGLLKSESKLMMECNHENLLKCIEVHENKELKLMILQYCEQGSLADELKNKKSFTEPEALNALRQMLNGLAELHRMCIIHRDLKTQNILIHNGMYKIADFGVSKKLEPGEMKQMERTNVGTPVTMAPEVYRREAYGFKADIWSLGAILFQLVFGQLEQDFNMNKLHLIIRKREFLQSEQYRYNNITASKEMTNLLRRMLAEQSTKRAGWSQLKQNTFLNEVSNKLASQFRVNVTLQISQQLIETSQKRDFTLTTILKDFSPHEEKSQHLKSSLSHIKSQVRGRMTMLPQQQIFQWSRLQYFQCLKIQLIFDQILDPIINNRLLNLEERSVIEFLFLIITRCRNNMSLIRERISNETEKQSLIYLSRMTQPLYNRVFGKWEDLSKNLTEIEDKFWSIFSDRLSKIINNRASKQKDRFLVGIQGVDYSREEQIYYTISFIPAILEELDSYSGKKIDQVKRLLNHYSEVIVLKLSDLKGRRLDETVSRIGKREE